MPQRFEFSTSWWGQAWVDALESSARLDPSRLGRGRSYARQGAVGALMIDPGRVRSRVSGSHGRHYVTEVEVRRIPDAAWDPVVDALASKSAHAAALADGELDPAIVADVRQRGNAITAGDVGYRYLLCALAAGGRSDVIFDLNNQSDKPGYGYQLKMGATSLTEAWDARRSSSHNHFMLGQIMEWFYHDLAGIASDPAGPGFRKIVIHPQPVGDVTWAKANYDSLHGKIAVQWDRTDGRFTLKAGVPSSQPPLTAATRDRYMSFGSVFTTCPNTTWPTSAPLTLARLRDSRTTWAARSVGGISFRLPPNVPMAVRTALTTTTSRLMGAPWG